MSVTLHHASYQQTLRDIGQCDMVFADPPDNIGLKYKGFKDDMPYDEYVAFLDCLINNMYDMAPISWLSFNAKWFGVVGSIIDQYRGWNPRLFVQTFTFGTNQRKEFVNGFRPILRLMRPGAETYPDAVYVESWRQKNGDKRASPKGRMPDDVWDFTRVVGNSPQRRDWSPTQLHEDLYKRAIDFSCEPGAKICDLFAGSGTMARVAGESHEVHLVELSDETAHNIWKEHQCEAYCYFSDCPVCS